jgi:predicted nucleotidyltransferase
MGLKLLLEDVLGRPVDLATPKMLRERTRASILREAVRVA